MAACSNCFTDEGLRLMAATVGRKSAARCSRCGSNGGLKLDRERLQLIAYTFFVSGTIKRWEHGAAPLVQFNDRRQTEVQFSSWLHEDTRIFEQELGIGFFHYGPREWMLGSVEPLLDLQRPRSQAKIIARVLQEYPALILTAGYRFYRLRRSPGTASDPTEYDSPPKSGGGRFDSVRLPVMYASPDIQLCVHECRATVDDELFMATLRPATKLSLLDLTEILDEEDTTEFDSLDLAIHMLFLAGSHSYDICRKLARAARRAGFDGLIYPSYFSLLRTGAVPFETSYGLAHRRIREFAASEKAKMVPNIALFGRPIREQKVHVSCINRVVMRQAQYVLTFGPSGVE